MLRNFLLGLIMLINGSVAAQLSVKARVHDQISGEAIPYVNIYYPLSGSGVISDLSGYFQLKVTGSSDTLIISAVGYRRIKMAAGELPERLLLSPDAAVMKTAEIFPSDDRYYFQILDSCRKFLRIYKGDARAVFHQSSGIDSVIVEQLDAYYNASCKGYELTKLDLKTGKFGLRPLNGNFFISYENAKAITLLPALQKPNYFPLQPLCMNVKQMREKYIAEVKREYNNEHGEHIIQLVCHPRDKSGAYFKAQYTINRTKGYIMEVELTGSTDQHHPFIPYPGDSLRSISWNIHKTYQIERDTLSLRQINFTYWADYLRLRNIQPNHSFTVRTEAILYIYNRQTPFLLPSYNFGTANPGDFRKINAYGYNDYFWNNHNEYRLADQDGAIPFYTNPAVVHSQKAFTPASFSKSGLFEHPYLHWSRNRFRIHQAVSDTGRSYNPRVAERDQYELSVQLMAELDTINGMHHLRTSVVVDPYQSYWRVPEDSLTIPFVNILFDHCEIKRRALEEKYASRTDKNVLIEIQTEFASWFRNFSDDYYRDVQRGHNIPALEKYAAIVEKELVIRNFHAPPIDLPEED